MTFPSPCSLAFSITSAGIAKTVFVVLVIDVPLSPILSCFIVFVSIIAIIG